MLHVECSLLVLPVFVFGVDNNALFDCCAFGLIS